MHANKKISIVIPIYNTAKYLPQSIDCVVSQDYENIEIILVDDGSTDSSGTICDNYAKSDSRILAIHKKNGGLSDARNTGLQLATGDFIVFIDSDDFLTDQKGFSHLMNEYSKTPECDFISYNCCYYYTDSNKLKKWKKYNKKLENSSSSDTIISTLISDGIFPMSACLKIIKKEFLLKNSLFFPLNTTGEDIPWFIAILSKVKTARFLNHYLYAYRQNVSGSITNSFTNIKYNNLLRIVKIGVEQLPRQFSSIETQNALLSFYAYEYTILLASTSKLSSSSNKINAELELKKYAYLLRYTLHPKVKLVSLSYKLLGRKATRILLSFYMNHR